MVFFNTPLTFLSEIRGGGILAILQDRFSESGTRGKFP